MFLTSSASGPPRLAARTALFAVLGLLAAGAPRAGAELVTNVTFQDSGGQFASYYAELTRQAQAAGRAWGRHLNVHADAVMDLEIRFDSTIATANGGARASSFVENRGGFNVYEWGTAAELRNGVDVNGSAADLRFTFSHDYVQNRFWYDPDPDARLAEVPAGMLDAQSTFLHEYGHALAFNGWSDNSDGSLPGTYRSTFDEHVAFDPGAGPGTGDDNLFFTGENARAVYGGDVPLTFGNAKHYGNRAPRPGQDLIDPNDLGLMNGVVNYTGVRRSISDLDAAFLRDAGLAMAPAAVPEPGTLLLVGAGGLGLFARRRRVGLG